MNLLALLLILSNFANADLKPEVRESIDKRCNSDDSEACAILAVETIKTNKDEGEAYFRRACKLGRTSSCVFKSSKDDIYIRKNKKPGSNVADKVPMRKWINRNMNRFLHVLFPTEKNNSNVDFSVDRCRIKNSKILSTLMSKKKVLTHKMKFGTGCDVQGVLNIQIDTPFEISLLVRKLDDIDKIEGQAQIHISYVNGLELKQTTELKEGSFLNADGQVLARFTATHDRNMEVSINDYSVTSLSNSGMIHLTEYYGTSVKEEIPFSLDYLDKKL